MAKVIYRQSVLTHITPIDVTLFDDGTVFLAQEGSSIDEPVQLLADQCRRLGGILSRCQELAQRQEAPPTVGEKVKREVAE